MKGARGLGVLVAAAVVAVAGGCGGETRVEHSAETVAVEDAAGDFLDYYEAVLHLSRRYGAHPDSFRTALDSLPGSHLTSEQWDAWTRPYRDRPELLAERLEKVLADLTGR